MITLSIIVSAGKFYVDGVLQDNLRLDAGNTYIFDYSAATAHPLSLSTTPDGVHSGGDNFIDGVDDLGNNQLQIEVTENTPDLYYFCQNHPGMGGSARVVSDVVAVAENSAVGSSVGITAYAEDLDAGDSVSYSLSDDAGGLFAIDANTGVVTLAGELDYETATSHDISVLATSTDGSTSTKTFTILLTDYSSDILEGTKIHNVTGEHGSYEVVGSQSTIIVNEGGYSSNESFDIETINFLIDATVFFSNSGLYSFDDEIEINFQPNTINTLYTFGQTLPYAQVTENDVFFEMHGGVVAINRDAADTGHLILDINHQVQNFDVASGYWSVTPSDWFTPYQVVTESNSDEASTYFSPNDYLNFMLAHMMMI